jgi:thiamine-monophosphate kinase
LTITTEFELIARYFAPLAEGAPGAFGLTDDAAALPSRRGNDLVLTKDAIVAGVHFLPDDPPGDIARKLLRVNLSDLAAKGAAPEGYLLAMALPSPVDEDWLAAFVTGLGEDQKQFGLHLYGGDTVATSGPLTLSMTAFGWVAAGRMLRRHCARPGDHLFVTGTIGDGMLGLRCLRGEFPALDEADRRHLVTRYRLPSPRLGVGAALDGMASAAIDVSDGLAADAGHIARVSGVRLLIEEGAVPLSHAARRLLAGGQVTFDALATGGDDYELLFTVPAEQAGRVPELAQAVAVPITRIGRVESGSGVAFVDANGQERRLKQGGYTHF